MKYTPAEPAGTRTTRPRDRQVGKHAAEPAFVPVTVQSDQQTCRMKSVSQILELALQYR
jgi:hypothetical protein